MVERFDTSPAVVLVIDDNTLSPSLWPWSPLPKDATANGNANATRAVGS